MDQAGVATIIGVTIGATTVADKIIERLWPSSRVNSILDIALLLLRGVQGALAASPKKSRQPRKNRDAVVGVRVGDAIVLEEVPAALSELLDAVGQGGAAVSPPPAAPAADPAYWEREDIRAWAAAHPQLAKALKRKYGLE